MDQIKIGKFIQVCRKEKNLTQSGLAEKLNVTNKAISRWETGRGMPDSSLLLELCNLLGISVNELLSGEKIEPEKYKEKAEENILVITKENEKHKINVKKIVVICLVISISMFVFLMYKVFINLYSSNVFRRIENYEPIFYQTINKENEIKNNEEVSIEVDNLKVSLKEVWFDGVDKERLSDLKLTEEEINKILKFSNGSEFNMLVEIKTLDETEIHEFIFGYMVYDNNKNLISTVIGSNVKIPMYHHFYNKYIKNKYDLKDINETVAIYMGQNAGECIIRDDLNSILYLIKDKKDTEVKEENIDLSKYHILLIGPYYKNNKNEVIDLSEKVLEFVVEK